MGDGHRHCHGLDFLATNLQTAWSPISGLAVQYLGTVTVASARLRPFPTPVPPCSRCDGHSLGGQAPGHLLVNTLGREALRSSIFSIQQYPASQAFAVCPESYFVVDGSGGVAVPAWAVWLCMGSTAPVQPPPSSRNKTLDRRTQDPLSRNALAAPCLHLLAPCS